MASKKTLINFATVIHTEFRKENYYLCSISILTKSKIMRCLNWVRPAMRVSNSTWLLRQKMEGNYSNTQFSCSFSTQIDPFSLCVRSRPQEGKSVSKETPSNQVRRRRDEFLIIHFDGTVNPLSYQSRHRQTTSATAKLKIQTVINSKWFLGAGMNHCPYMWDHSLFLPFYY